LTELAALPLPPPPHPHPGHGGTTKAYALARQRHIISRIAAQVAALAAPRLSAIQALSRWEDKQDAVDALFEGIEFTLQQEEVILGKHPKFGQWVERSLEAYLKSIQKKEATLVAAVGGEGTDASAAEEASDTHTDTSTETETTTDTTVFSTAGPQLPTAEQDATALPLFVDFFGTSDDPDANIPSILSPLVPLARGTNQGRMMEEWELAAHKTTKRILLRQATRAAAQFVAAHPVARVLLTGRQGTGKTAALLTLVAAARQEGHVVLFLPHCDRMAEHGFYIEPNEHRPGLYDLPVLSQQICAELLASHKGDVANLLVTNEILDEFFAPDQQTKLGAAAGGSSTSSDDKVMSVADLLTVGSDKRALSPMCFAAAVDTLMKQEEVPFTMVLDEFNTLYQPGKYFHEHYDTDVRKAIPYHQISLFRQALQAMGLVASDQEALPEPVLMKRGSVIAAMTHSKPVADVINTALVASAQEAAAASTQNTQAPPLLVSDVPRLSTLEVDHLLANYEAIGLGKLRMDQGETVTNAQEVAYLRTGSSNVPQELMNACLM
jgi:small subunit ribosomal protein S29